jgi:hypothetical protein
MEDRCASGSSGSPPVGSAARSLFQVASGWIGDRQRRGLWPTRSVRRWAHQPHVLTYAAQWPDTPCRYRHQVSSEYAERAHCCYAGDRVLGGEDRRGRWPVPVDRLLARLRGVGGELQQALEPSRQPRLRSRRPIPPGLHGGVLSADPRRGAREPTARRVDGPGQPAVAQRRRRLSLQKSGRSGARRHRRTLVRRLDNADGSRA